MPQPPKDPSQRRRRNREQPTRAASTALPDTNRRKAPPPPKGLPAKLHAAYREAWRSSVANLWAPSAAPLVARLVRLRDFVDTTPIADVKPAHLSALLQLERELLLGQKAARASGVTVRDESAPEADVEDVDEKPAPRRRKAGDAARRRRVHLRAVGDGE